MSPISQSVSPARFRYRLRRVAYSAVAPSSTSADDGAVSEAAEAALQEVEALNDKYMRSRAELENYRKRVMRERDELRKYAGEEVIKSLLATIDNLERAIQGAEVSQDIEALHRGVEMVHQQFLESLTRQGLEVIAPATGDKFDPSFHEAVLVEANDEIESECVIECLQAGYSLNKRVLRAAMVKVAQSD